LKDGEKYTTFTIPKKGGGTREISAPNSELKSLQKKLAAKLEECLSDIRIANTQIQSCSHGFTHGKSIITNGKVHRNKRYVFNIDLKDFFPSVSGARIRGFLINDRSFRFHPIVATTIAHIACQNNALPQGSPSSPVLSNLIAGILDFRLHQLAKSNGCAYTRYVDDITFSTNKTKFPSSLAFREDESGDRWTIGRKLNTIIEKTGFSVNDKKTRLQYKNSRQVVTGLVVNKRVNVTSDYRKLIRAYVYSFINQGKFIIKTQTENDTEEPVKEIEGTRAQLHGMLGFIHSVDSVYKAEIKENYYNYPGLVEKKDDIPKGLATYRRFLLFTRFYDGPMPLIVCEGKTDGVYISNAIHMSKINYPELIKKENEKDVLSFQFFKYARYHKKENRAYVPRYSTASILGVDSGGAPNLKKLFDTYYAEHLKFKVRLGPYPVILLLDSDEEGHRALKGMLKRCEKTLSVNQPYIHLFANLYVVLIPGQGTIENLFSESDIRNYLAGKKIPLPSDKDALFASLMEYKNDFAYEHVSKHSDRLTWSGFTTLLENISKVFEDYRVQNSI